MEYCAVLEKRKREQQRDFKFSTKSQDNPSLFVSPYVLPSLPGLSEFGIHVLQDILQFIGRDGAISVLVLSASQVREFSANGSTNHQMPHMFVIGKK
jgi:hypothetical protein